MGRTSCWGSYTLARPNLAHPVNSPSAAGATLVREPRDQFYGERSGSVRDPFGHEVEKVSPDEMQRRYTAMMSET
jgi:hypothetical protein